jgi:predicted ArsR family transcriptional regulator
MGLAPATVRRHLDILQRDGLAVFSEVRKGTGRPEHSFTLTEPGHESLPKGYGALLGGLIGELARTSADEIAGKNGAEALRGALAKLGQAVARQYAGSGEGAPVEAALKALRDGDFEPDARQDGDRARISLSNCPFRLVALTDDAICAYDTAILQAILGTAMKLERSITKGHACCEYATAPKGAPPESPTRAVEAANGPSIVDALGGELLR